MVPEVVMDGVAFTGMVRVCVGVPARLLATTLTVMLPETPLVTVPWIVPSASRIRPVLEVMSVEVKVGAGKPVAVTVKPEYVEPAVPEGAVEALVKAGASSFDLTVRA